MSIDPIFSTGTTAAVCSTHIILHLLMNLAGRGDQMETINFAISKIVLTN